MAFCDWLLSLSIMFVRFIHTYVCFDTLLHSCCISQSNGELKTHGDAKFQSYDDSYLPHRVWPGAKALRGQERSNSLKSVSLLRDCRGPLVSFILEGPGQLSLVRRPQGRLTFFF